MVLAPLLNQMVAFPVNREFDRLNEMKSLMLTVFLWDSGGRESPPTLIDRASCKLNKT
jgi:hypothetical protein